MPRLFCACVRSHLTALEHTVMTTQEKRDFVIQEWRAMVRDGFMSMPDHEIVSLVNSLNAAELAVQFKEAKELARL